MLRNELQRITHDVTSWVNHIQEMLLLSLKKTKTITLLPRN